MRSTPNHLVRDHWVLFNDWDGTLVDDNDVTRNDITQQECYMAVYNSNVSESPIVAPVLQDNSHIQITPASATILSQNQVLQDHSHSQITQALTKCPVAVENSGLKYTESLLQQV